MKKSHWLIDAMDTRASKEPLKSKLAAGCGAMLVVTGIAVFVIVLLWLLDNVGLLG
jgi:hypothetical protein